MVRGNKFIGSRVANTWLAWLGDYLFLWSIVSGLVSRKYHLFSSKSLHTSSSC